LEQVKLTCDSLCNIDANLSYSIRSLLIFFGPILVPKALSYYRSIRNAPKLHGLTIQPVPAHVQRVLLLLFAVAGAYLLKSLPIFAPENVFRLTQSRLQITTDVLFNRLSALRPQNALTPTDEALRAKFINLESRLLYFQFGPDTLAGCPFCSSEEPKSYLYYHLPSLAIPHLFNIVVITAATSSLLSRGRETAQWRTAGAIAAVALLLLDIYLVSVYNYQANAVATRLQGLDFFYWDMRTYRLVALAALDGLLGWVIWLSATNRAFVTPPSTAERVELVTRSLMGTKARLSAVGIVKNSAVRDEELRARNQAYWAHEGQLMREVMEEREVIEGVNDALEKRINIGVISRDAENYAATILQPGMGSTES
jgi:hypothetical protein